MARLSSSWLLFLLLAASLTAASSASTVPTDPGPDSKPALTNSVNPVPEIIKNRKGHALQSDASHANYFKYPMAQQQYPASQELLPNRIAFPPVEQSIHPDAYSVSDASLYSNLDDYMNSFYSKMPKVVEKYSSKLKELMPYIRPHHGSAAAAASRVWQNIPSRREIADRAFGAISGAVTAIGLTIVSPLVATTAALFVIFSVILVLFPAVSAFGRRRVGRDLFAAKDLNNQVFDFDRFLPPEQSTTLASLAARLDSVLDTYMAAYKDDTCLERYYCEVGQMTNRWAKFTEPIIT